MVHFIQIAGWSNPRMLAVRPSSGRLVLQIRLAVCKTCSACENRYREIAARVNELHLEGAEWENDGEILSLPVPPAPGHEEKLAFLQTLFGRPVRFLQLVPDDERRDG
ncbi:MAG: hypothetical protein Q7S95_03115 [bacterium]|nr:hypothetical protein [bacterium]